MKNAGDSVKIAYQGVMTEGKNNSKIPKQITLPQSLLLGYKFESIYYLFVVFLFGKDEKPKKNIKKKVC